MRAKKQSKKHTVASTHPILIEDFDEKIFERTNELNELTRIVASCRWTHIYGKANVGKSFLVNQWLQIKENTQNKNVFKISCTDINTINDCIVANLHSKGTNECLVYTNQQLAEAWGKVFELAKSDKDAIWVFDKITSSTLEYIHSKIPCASFKGKIISTATSQNISPKQFRNLGLIESSKFKYLKILPLSESEIQQYVNLLLKDIPGDKEISHDFPGITGGLPIVIHLFCNYYLNNITKYKDFNSYCEIEHNRTPSTFGDILADSVKDLINWTFHKKPKTRKLFERFVILSVYLGQEPIPIAWLNSVTKSEEKTNKIIVICSAMGLLRYDQVSRTFIFPKVYRRALQTIYFNVDLSTLVKIARHLNEHFGYKLTNGYEESYENMVQYVPHINRVLQRLEQEYNTSQDVLPDSDCMICIDLFSNLSKYYLNIGQLKEALEYLQACDSYFTKNNILNRWNIEFYKLRDKEFKQRLASTKSSRNTQENFLVRYACKILLPLGSTHAKVTTGSEEHPYQDSLRWLLSAYHIQRNILDKNKEKNKGVVVSPSEANARLNIQITTTISGDIDELSLAHTIRSLIHVYIRSINIHKDMMLNLQQSNPNSTGAILHHQNTIKRTKKYIHQKINELKTLINENKNEWDSSVLTLFEMDMGMFERVHEDNRSNSAQRNYSSAISQLENAYKNCQNELQAKNPKLSKNDFIKACIYLADVYYSTNEFLKCTQFYLQFLMLTREDSNLIHEDSLHVCFWLTKILYDKQYFGLAAIFINFALMHQDHVYRKSPGSYRVVNIKKLTILAMDIAKQLQYFKASPISIIHNASATFQQFDHSITKILDHFFDKFKHHPVLTFEFLNEENEKLIRVQKQVTKSTRLAEQKQEIDLFKGLIENEKAIKETEKSQAEQKYSLEMQRFLHDYWPDDKDTFIYHFGNLLNILILQRLEHKLKRALNIPKTLSKSDMARKVINALSLLVPDISTDLKGTLTATFSLQKIISGITDAIADRSEMRKVAESSHLNESCKDLDDFVKRIIERTQRMSIYAACCYHNQLKKLTQPNDVKKLATLGAYRVVSYMIESSTYYQRILTPEKLVIQALVRCKKNHTKQLSFIDGHSWDALRLFKTAVKVYDSNSTKIRLRNSMTSEEFSAYGPRLTSSEEYSDLFDWNEYDDETSANSSLKHETKCVIF